MPLLQGQPFRLIKPPENVEPGAELYTIQHTGEKFISKSDYEDRLALYSQSIWTCQCSGKSGMTHQEAWTSEAKVRVMLTSSFPAPLWAPVLHCIHHSTQPLDQLVETASTLCISKFHPGEEVTLLSPTSVQVRVLSSREAPVEIENGASPEKPKSVENIPSTLPATPQTNGCSTMNREGSSINGATNGSAVSDEGSPPGGTKGKEDSPNKKKGLLPLLYDVVVIGEDRKVADVPAKCLQRAYKVPPKEHFRLFIRAHALRQRASAYTPWIVSEELVKQFDIPSKLASVFTQPKFNFTGKKRKLEQNSEGKAKKPRAEKTGDEEKKKKSEEKKVKKEPKDRNRKKPKLEPKKEVKDILKVEPLETKVSPVKQEIPIKMEISDSDDDISLAALKYKSPKQEGSSDTPKLAGSTVVQVKRESGKERQASNKKMKQATLFDMKQSKKNVDGTPKPVTPRKSPQKRVVTPESVMKLPIMRRLLHERKLYKGVKGMARKIVYTMDLALGRLSLRQLEVIPDEELREEMKKRRARLTEKRIIARMSAADKEEYLKQRAEEEKRKRMESRRELTLKLQEKNRKVEDKILHGLKPLPPPKLVPTPDDIPNSLFGDITMIVEFIECYRDVVLSDKKASISCQHLMQALAAGKNGFKFISEIMVLLLHIIIDDERIGDSKELGLKISELAVHYQTAIELARLCLGNRETSDAASQHSDDNELGEEQCELSEGLLKKLETHELYELQPDEIIEVLKALCHRAMSSYTSLEHFEDIEEKALALNREHNLIKKENLKQEMEKKKQMREELQKKKKEKQSSPKKPRGRPKRQENTLEDFIKKDEPASVETPGEEEQDSPDIISAVKRKRLTVEELQKEKEVYSMEIKEKRIKEEEEKKKALFIQQWEKINLHKDLLTRLQPLGCDRNHDRYWLFNSTTPGLYVEKGWVDVNTTYCVRSPSPRKDTSGTIPDGGKSPKSVAVAIKFTTPEKSTETPGSLSGISVSTTSLVVSSSMTPVGATTSVVCSTVASVVTTASVVTSSAVGINLTPPTLPRSVAPESVAGSLVSNSRLPSSTSATLTSNFPATSTKMSSSGTSLSDAKAASVAQVSSMASNCSTSSSVKESLVTCSSLPAQAPAVVDSSSVKPLSNTVAARPKSVELSKNELTSDDAVTKASTDTTVSDTTETKYNSEVPVINQNLDPCDSVLQTKTMSLVSNSVSSTSSIGPVNSSIVAAKSVSKLVTSSSSLPVSSTQTKVPQDRTSVSEGAAISTTTNQVSSPVYLSASASLSTSTNVVSSSLNATVTPSVAFPSESSKLLLEADSDSDEKPLAVIQKKLEDMPLSLIQKELEEKPLSVLQKELADSPAKRPRGRPPKPRTPGEMKGPPRPRGRPPKEKPPKTPPRPRGRPPKIKSPDGIPLKNPDGTVLNETGEGSPSKTPGKRGRPKVIRTLNEDETFPPVGQNMWFYYNTLEEIDQLVEALASKGIRESKLKAVLIQARKNIEANFVNEWKPLEDFVDGSVQLMETLREDIIQIEHELTEGWLGSVPDSEEWEKKANEAKTVQELGECLIEAQRHMQIKFLRGIMKPMKKPIPSDNPEAPPEYEEIEVPAVQQWRDAVSSCTTLSRLHLLVGIFDSCIKWEKSLATKKCKVCRCQDLSTPLAICDKCEGSYHWHCLRPQLQEEPPEPWLCPACQPSKNKERRNVTRWQLDDEREEPPPKDYKQEKICRVCDRGLGLIFCSTCPAAYHSECHDPPLQSRARKDWKCVDCLKPKGRQSRSVAAKSKQSESKMKESNPSKSNSSTKNGGRSASSKISYYEEDADEDEEEEESEEEKPKKSSRSSSRKSSGRNAARSTSSRRSKYKDDEDEEEEDDDDSDYNKKRQNNRNNRKNSGRNASRYSSSKKNRYEEDDEEEEEEEEDEDEEAEGSEDDLSDEDYSTSRRKSSRVRKPVKAPTRTTSRIIKKKSYKIESEEEEEDEEEVEEEAVEEEDSEEENIQEDEEEEEEENEQIEDDEEEEDNDNHDAAEEQEDEEENGEDDDEEDRENEDEEDNDEHIEDNDEHTEDNDENTEEDEENYNSDDDREEENQEDSDED